LFRVDESDAGPILACAACGRAFGAVSETRLARLEQEVQQVREELARLRQAVNFLNQRVR
jgi:cell division protein FtsB